MNTKLPIDIKNVFLGYIQEQSLEGDCYGKNNVDFDIDCQNDDNDDFALYGSYDWGWYEDGRLAVSFNKISLININTEEEFDISATMEDEISDYIKYKYGVNELAAECMNY